MLTLPRSHHPGSIQGPERQAWTSCGHSLWPRTCVDALRGATDLSWSPVLSAFSLKFMFHSRNPLVYNTDISGYIRYGASCADKSQTIRCFSCLELNWHFDLKKKMHPMCQVLSGFWGYNLEEDPVPPCARLPPGPMALDCHVIDLVTSLLYVA